MDVTDHCMLSLITVFCSKHGMETQEDALSSQSLDTIFPH